MLSEKEKSRFVPAKNGDSKSTVNGPGYHCDYHYSASSLCIRYCLIWFCICSTRSSPGVEQCLFKSCWSLTCLWSRISCTGTVGKHCIFRYWVPQTNHRGAMAHCFRSDCFCSSFDLSLGESFMSPLILRAPGLQSTLLGRWDFLAHQCTKTCIQEITKLLIGAELRPNLTS